MDDGKCRRNFLLAEIFRFFPRLWPTDGLIWMDGGRFFPGNKIRRKSKKSSTTSHDTSANETRPFFKLAFARFAKFDLREFTRKIGGKLFLFQHAGFLPASALFRVPLLHPPHCDVSNTLCIIP